MLGKRSSDVTGRFVGRVERYSAAREQHAVRDA